MKKRLVSEQQLLRLQNIEANLYDGIRIRQKQLQRELQKRVHNYNCPKQRDVRIKQKNVPQQITHPANNDRWMQLGFCIEDFESANLDDIRARQQQRKKQRQRILQYKSLEAKGRQIFSTESNQQENYGLKKGRKQKQQKIPFKLMRKIRQADVKQNKKRIQNQAEKYYQEEMLKRKIKDEIQQKQQNYYERKHQIQLQKRKTGKL